MNYTKEQKIINYYKEQLNNPQTGEPDQQLIILEAIFQQSLFQRLKVNENLEVFDNSNTTDYHYEKLSAQNQNQDNFIELNFALLDLIAEIESKLKGKHVWQPEYRTLNDTKRHLNLLHEKVAKVLGLAPQSLKTTLRSLSKEEIRDRCVDPKIKDTQEMLVYTFHEKSRRKLNDLDTMFGGKFSLIDKWMLEIHKQTTVEKAQVIFEKALWELCEGTLFFLEINYYDGNGNKLYDFLKKLPRNIRNVLYFVDQNEERTWDKYREIIDKELSVEQIQELFYFQEPERIHPKTKAELIDILNQQKHNYETVIKYLIGKHGEETQILNYQLAETRSHALKLRDYGERKKQELQALEAQLNQKTNQILELLARNNTCDNLTIELSGKVVNLEQALAQLETIAQNYWTTSQAEIKKWIIEAESHLDALQTSERWNKDKFAKLDEQKENLISIIRQKNNELEELETQLSLLDFNNSREINQFLNQIEDWKKKFEKEKIITNSYREVKQELEVQSKKDRDNFINLLRYKQRKIEEQEKELDSNDELLGKKNQIITDKNRDYAELETTGQRLLDAYNRQEKDLLEQRQQITDLEQEIKNLTVKGQQKQKQIIELSQTVGTDQTKIKDLTELLTQQRNETQDQANKLTTVQQKLDRSSQYQQNQIKNLTQQLQKRQQTLTQAQAQKLSYENYLQNSLQINNLNSLPTNNTGQNLQQLITHYNSHSSTTLDDLKQQVWYVIDRFRIDQGVFHSELDNRLNVGQHWRDYIDSATNEPDLAQKELNVLNALGKIIKIKNYNVGQINSLQSQISALNSTIATQQDQIDNHMLVSPPPPLSLTVL